VISITDDDYETIVEVGRTGLTRLPAAIFEKDLLVTKTLGLVQDFNWDKFSIVFCGGTSLSKGYELIERMSEDIDFKVIVPPSLSHSQRRKKLGDLCRNLTQHLRGAVPPTYITLQWMYWWTGCWSWAFSRAIGRPSSPAMAMPHLSPLYRPLAGAGRPRYGGIPTGGSPHRPGARHGAHRGTRSVHQ